MSHTRQERRERVDPKLEMTPMIDVVFQLLIFFVVALRQDDLLAHLDVTVPAPIDHVEDMSLCNVTVCNGGYLLDGVKRSLPGMDAALGKLAKFNPGMPLTLRCTSDSQHGDMIRLLDVCAKHNLRNISVFSL